MCGAEARDTYKVVADIGGPIGSIAYLETFVGKANGLVVVGQSKVGFGKATLWEALAIG